MKHWKIKVGSLPVTVIKDGDWVHLVASTAEFCSNLQDVQKIAVAAGIPSWIMALVAPFIPRQPQAQRFEKSFLGVTFRFGPEQTSVSFVMGEQKLHEVFLLPFKEGV